MKKTFLIIYRFGFIAALALFFFSLFTAACASVGTRADRPYDTAWWVDRDHPANSAGPRKGVVSTSYYLTMRDGVKIAADVHLPADLRPGEKLPTVFMQTRYWRSPAIRWPLSAFYGMPDELRRVVEHGYAVVRMDVRGTGASFGFQSAMWSEDEVRDGGDVVDWIVAQPWSDGAIGAVGGSYEGTSAEFLLLNRRSAVKAVAPMFALYDVYTDIAYPGGIHLSWFTEIWQRGNYAMDHSAVGNVLWWAPLVTSGVSPVAGDKGRAQLKAAIKEHDANIKVHKEAMQIVYRDDVSSGGLSMERISPHAYIKAMADAGVPIYSYSGWYDGGYAFAAIKRFLTVRTPGSKLVIGPWDHGGPDQIRPFEKTRDAKFDHVDEVMRFFDKYVRGIDDGIGREPPVHYYTVVEDAWKSADTWPPASRRTPLYLAAGHTLRWDKPAEEAGEDAYAIDPKAATGSLSRWNALAIETRVAYPDREKRDKRLLVYDSPQLPHDAEVTGHPLVTLHLSADAADAQVFVYLEDVDEKGRVAYVTEGMLRALHRSLSDEAPPYVSPVPYRSFLRKDARPLVPGEAAELAFDLQPVSYLYRKGHRVRIAVAGADADHFRALTDGPKTLRIQRDAAHPSRIDLPIVEKTPAAAGSPRVP